MPLPGPYTLRRAMSNPGPILVTELFPKLNQKLTQLLKSLKQEDWSRPVARGSWNVKDVAAHLLDTTLRRLSIERDRYINPHAPKLQSDRDLTKFVNQTNAEWVKAARRLSPQILIELLELAGREMYEFFKALDLHQPAIFPVSWAGDQVSPNWFDVAREYTEKWHHQEQIREAVGKPGLTSREYLLPVLDTFMRALPYAYRQVRAAEGTLIKVKVTGSAAADWFLLRSQNRWQLLLDLEQVPDTIIQMPQEIAWKLFTKGIDRGSAERAMKFEGRSDLGRPMLSMVCIIG